MVNKDVTGREKQRPSGVIDPQFWVTLPMLTSASVCLYHTGSQKKQTGSSQKGGKRKRNEGTLHEWGRVKRKWETTTLPGPEKQREGMFSRTQGCL